METIRRKARQFFDTTAQPSHVTFDDGKNWRRNLPWLRYAGAHWSYAEPDMIRLEIDEWSIVICGHRLESLFRAIEDATLTRVRAYPEWEHDHDREPDTFATSIRFVRQSALSAPPKRKRDAQLALPFAKADGAARSGVQK